MLLIAAAIAAGPLLILGVLTLAGSLDPGAATVAAVSVVAAALAAAAMRAREHRRLVAAVRRAAEGGTALLDPPLTRHSEIAGLIRAMSQRSDIVAQRLRTEEAIIEGLPDPLMVLSAERSVLRANAAARAAYGSEMPAVLRHPGLRGAIDRLDSQGKPQTADLVLPVPVEREVHVTVFRLAGNRVAAVLSDRTRERALERMRADFVANASHELRTPLASLIGFIDTLRGPAADDPPAQARFLQIMAEQAARMTRLIDDLLSLSRIELTEHQLPTDKVLLPELLRWTAASFEPRVNDRGIHLEVTAPGDLPPVAGDEDQLGQVLQNLLDNAVKYGREGGTVRVTAAVAEPGGRWPGRPGVTIAVSDDGAGIPRQHLSRLTERFYRVDKGRSRAVGGTGLGLAIVKHIVNRHRGQLVIDSREGEGATFTVWLPTTQGRG
jgi:two-component system phosphate regulon sensor histidine kinase PhoR